MVSWFEEIKQKNNNVQHLTSSTFIKYKKTSPVKSHNLNKDIHKYRG